MQFYLVNSNNEGVQRISMCHGNGLWCLKSGRSINLIFLFRGCLNLSNTVPCLADCWARYILAKITPRTEKISLTDDWFTWKLCMDGPFLLYCTFPAGLSTSLRPVLVLEFPDNIVIVCRDSRGCFVSYTYPAHFCSNIGCHISVDRSQLAITHT